MIIEEIQSAPPLATLARAWHRAPGFFYLDSARPEDGRGRAFSFLGFAPFLTWQATGRTVVVTTADSREESQTEPLAHLRELLGRYRVSTGGGLPFAGGAVGYFGYECGVRSEKIAVAASADPLPPEAQFGLYDGVIAFDHGTKKMFAVANPVARQRAGEILARLRDAVASAIRTEPEAADRSQPSGLAVPELAADLTRSDYLARIARIKDYIAAGDVYQVNFAQRFELATVDDPYAIYQRLRRLSPAPFGAYLNGGDFQILSSSPELFLRCEANGKLVTRPIKGTRPRGRTPEEDQRQAAELLASEKDHAELLMIVDLARNDLGRVCRFGSVRVEERYRIEAHPTVFHLVATVAGELAPDRDVFDGLRSMLPGGSITGAPKIRAMQIINELEPCRRQIYTGSLGYLGFDGTCDLNIAIRTITCRSGRAHYHVGGGIVADSDPESEYQETLAKGRAMRAALLGEELA